MGGSGWDFYYVECTIPPISGGYASTIEAIGINEY